LLLSALIAALAEPALAQTAPPPAPPPKPPACADDAHYQQFDFWLGAWQVGSDKPGAAKSADVMIERTLGGCALKETWTSTRGPGGNGSGMATYSRLSNTWRYFWVSAAGANTDFPTGALTADGAMQFTVSQPDPSGGVRLRHWTVAKLRDGRLSEVAVGSLDGGKTWTPEYQLFWTKVQP
jgi:hypothetical protein